MDIIIQIAVLIMLILIIMSVIDTFVSYFPRESKIRRWWNSQFDFGDDE